MSQTEKFASELKALFESRKGDREKVRDVLCEALN